MGVEPTQVRSRALADGFEDRAHHRTGSASERGMLVEVCHDNFRRISHEAVANKILGTPIHKTSLSSTSIPRSLKNPEPMGDTSIGRHEKKNLSVLKGASSATPSPPFVSISRSGWETVTAAK